MITFMSQTYVKALLVNYLYFYNNQMMKIANNIVYLHPLLLLINFLIQVNSTCYCRQQCLCDITHDPVIPTILSVAPLPLTSSTFGVYHVEVPHTGANTTSCKKFPLSPNLVCLFPLKPECFHSFQTTVYLRRRGLCLS